MEVAEGKPPEVSRGSPPARPGLGSPGSPIPNAHCIGRWGGGLLLPRQAASRGGRFRTSLRKPVLAVGRRGGSLPKAQTRGARPGRPVAACEGDSVAAALTGSSRGQVPSPCLPLPLSQRVLRADVSAPSKLPTLFLNLWQLRKSVLAAGRTWPPGQRLPQIRTQPRGFPSPTHPVHVTLLKRRKHLPRKGGEGG